MPIFILIGIAVAIVGGEEAIERYMVRRLASKTCTGKSWRRLFPSATANDIRQYLDTALGVFNVPKCCRLRYEPDVRLMDLYRAVNPRWISLGIDGIELEVIADEVQDRFGLDLNACWNDELTLGQVFVLATASAERSPAGRG